MDNSKVVDKREDILKILEEAVTKNSEVILWQKINLQRKMILAQIKFINQEENTLLFKSLNNVNFCFEEENPLHVKSDFRNLFFKGQIQLMRENLLIMVLPQQIDFLDLREKERKILFLGKDHYLTFETEAETNKSTNSQQNFNEYHVKILDITKGGASVEIPAKDLNEHEEGQSVWITSIAAIGLSQKLAAEIVYIIPLQTTTPQKGSQSYRMGLKFQKSLPETLLLTLQDLLPSSGD